jgi:hypothetical protein
VTFTVRESSAAGPALVRRLHQVGTLLKPLVTGNAVHAFYTYTRTTVRM